jgi:hypothetical protein
VLSQIAERSIDFSNQILYDEDEVLEIRALVEISLTAIIDVSTNLNFIKPVITQIVRNI